MFTHEEKIRRLKSLSRLEMEVLYYFGQGMTDSEICTKLGGIVPKTLITRRTGIYKNLGIDVPDKEKQNYLAQEYGRLIPEVCPNEDALKRWRPTKLEEHRNKPEDNSKEPEVRQNNPRRMNFGLLLIFLLIIAVVGYGAYLFGRGSAPSAILPAITAVTKVVTENAPQATVPSTPTIGATVAPLVVPSIIPTDTLIPTLAQTDTPAPSATAVFVPPADGILFQDNFANGIGSDWTNTDNWLISNARLTLGTSASFNNTYNWIGLDKPEWKNYTISVNIKIPFQDSAAQSYVAVAVRTGGSQSKYIGVLIDDFDNVYWAFFGATDSGVAPISGQNRSSRFTSGSSLQIEVQGNNYTVKANGQQIQTISLQGYDSGGIALGVDCFSAQECASFGNLKVTYLP